MYIFKKMKIIFVLIVIAYSQAAQAVIAAHTSSCYQHSSFSCKEISDLSSQFSGAINRYSGGLDVLFTDMGTAGVNSTTLALLSAYNSGQIFPEAQNFGTALINSGICPPIAHKAVNQLQAYAEAAENYTIDLNLGKDPSTALAAWNGETDKLISALHAIPNIKLPQIKSLIDELQQIQLDAIQAFAIKNFERGVTARIRGQSVNDMIVRYFTQQLLFN